MKEPKKKRKASATDIMRENSVMKAILYNTDTWQVHFERFVHIIAYVPIHSVREGHDVFVLPKSQTFVPDKPWKKLIGTSN